jgi:hypothetical protein
VFFFRAISDRRKQKNKVANTKEFKVAFEQFTWQRLHVIFHIDRSDPVVAVALTSHVGSAREKNRTLPTYLNTYCFNLLGKPDKMSLYWRWC